MDIQKQEKPQNTSCLINDENNNCTNCEYKTCFEEKNMDRMRIVPDNSSDDDDEYWCSSCSSGNDSEIISLDTRKLWHDIAHMIKCIYRETNREFQENHSTNDICKAKEYVQILTQSNAELLFNKVESIVLEYVNEIRNQVLKRSQTCVKTSNDVQLFISYLLDEYNTFIQAAKNVSSIVSYLEENYMKSFDLTWLLYNKHLYEKLVYMDKRIQQSMSNMIDLLQPTNEIHNDYSPAEYTLLLNRFLAFDEEMSEIACLYKDCQMKMSSISKNFLNKNRNQMGIIVKKTTKKKLCKKTKKTKKIQGLTKENLNSTTSNAVNIPLSNNCSTMPTVSQQDSNGSSIGSGVGGKESSSISSFDDYLIDNNTSASSYTKDETDNLIENNIDTTNETLLPQTNNTNSSTSEIDNNVSSTTKKSKTTRRKETSNPSKTSLTPDLILPPKPPSKLQTDLRPILTKTEIPACPSLLSKKIQSVSFTAGTFGSITTTEPTMNQTRLSLSLSRRTGPSLKPTDSTIDQLLRQAASPNEISALLSSLDSSKSTCDFCCCDILSESNSSTPNSCITCMSLANPSTILSTFNPREIQRKERLQLKITKRTVQNSNDHSPSPSASSTTGNKLKTTKPSDNNIDDLVRFIDGDETNTNEKPAKKTKKKKKKTTTQNTNVENEQNSSKQNEKEELKTEEKQPMNRNLSPTPPPRPSSLEQVQTVPINIEKPRLPEKEEQEEETVNWITISRKQSKHKPTTVPTPPVNNNPNSNSKPKRQQTKTNAQPKVIIQETVQNSNKSQTNESTTRVKNTNKPSVWNNNKNNDHEKSTLASSSNLVATAPVFIPSSSSLLISNQTNNILPIEQPSAVSSSSSSSLYWDPDGYLLPPNPVQRPPSSSSSSSFSPAPGPRCIRRPSPEPSSTTTTSFPINNTWSDTSEKNSNQSQWNYPYEESLQIPNDFPLYDPFKSGAGITIPGLITTNGFENNQQDNDIDEMDAFEKEIEDFKKCYIDNIPLDPCENISGNIDHRFIRQS